MKQIVTEKFSISHISNSPLAITIVVSALYAVVARICFTFSLLPGGVAPIFPPAGIALAAVFIFGRSALYGVWLGSFVAILISFFITMDLSFHSVLTALLVSTFIGSGAMTNAGVGNYLIRRFFKDEYPLHSGWNVFILVTVGALGCCMISATIGTFSLALGGYTTWKLFGYSWMTWWIGDVSGIIIIAPFIFAWYHKYIFPKNPKYIIEAVLLGILTLFLSFLIFFRNLPFEYGLMPIFLWSAFRFGMRGVSTTAVVIAILATLATSNGSGPFVRDNVHESLLLLHSFLGVNIICALLLAGVLAERKHAEENLKNSEKKYRTLIEQASDGILIIDSDGNYVDANSSASQMLGYSRDEFHKMNMRHLISEEDLLKQFNTFEKLSKGENVLTELKLKCKNDNYINTELNAKMLPDGRFCAIVRDITERKKSEAEHIRLQNLESLGILAGGIAHDFNNILAVILGQASIVRNRISDKRMRNYLESIEKASQRAVGLTQQLLTFAKGGTPEKCFVDIRKIIQDTVNFSLSGSNITPVFDFYDTFNLLADSSQISQVIQNLVINAKQAMPSGGKIKISTENYIDFNNEKFIKIAIEDEGIGISKEYLTKIFDPYFTTKQTGSGLGLSVCYSIISRHDGKIYAHSELGKGTTFTILLPATEKENIIEKFDEKIVDEKYTVLIMDDELEIRELLSNMLLELGHKVTVTSKGEEALQIYHETKKEGNSFDLVFMDLTIKGGMGGKEAIKKLKEIDWNAKVIVSSGYADSSVAKFKEDGFDGILNKPYRIEDLNRAIFDVMNK